MHTKNTFSNVLKSCLYTLILTSTALVAEEGGSGHYLPGSMASFMDGVPTEPTFIVRLNYMNYQGSSSIPLPRTGGGIITNADATANALAATVLWAPDWDLGWGDKWQFAMSATIPVLNMDLSGGVLGITRQNDRTALGDIVLMPLMVNYNVNKDLNINARLGFYAPTGDYELGRFVNNGKNFWTAEPTIGIVYFGQKNGIEASLFFGVDYNWENPDTNYKSGTQIHFDGTLAQHFPFAGGISGVGVTAYWYNQVNDDSGEGVAPIFANDFQAKAAGVGPVVSWMDKTGKYIAELKYLSDFENENRLDGDTLWFKFITKF
jgi:hypothetical protein